MSGISFDEPTIHDHLTKTLHLNHLTQHIEHVVIALALEMLADARLLEKVDCGERPKNYAILRKLRRRCKMLSTVFCAQKYDNVSHERHVGT